MKQWSFYCKPKLCSGIRASKLQGGRGEGRCRQKYMVQMCFTALDLDSPAELQSHARRPPQVTASPIALPPMVLLLVIARRLFSRPLLILLCCLISKDLPCTGSQSQLDVTTTCLHVAPSFPYKVFFFPLQVRRQKNWEHFYIIKDLCRSSQTQAK